MVPAGPTHEHVGATGEDDGAPSEQHGAPGALGDRLKGAGKRLTPQRRLVLEAVERLGHATPDEVLAEARRHKPELSLSTVYRNLEVLEELGLVRHAHLTDRAPTYHSIGGHEHFHLVCRGCGEVTSVGPSLLAPLLEQLDAEFGFVPDVGHLTVFGSCRSCR